MILRSNLLLLAICLGGGGISTFSEKSSSSRTSSPLVVSALLPISSFTTTAKTKGQLTVLSSSLTQHQQQLDEKTVQIVTKRSQSTNAVSNTATFQSLTSLSSSKTRKRRRRKESPSSPSWSSPSLTRKQMVQARPYKSAIKVLRLYHSMHGTLAMPRRFIVPQSAEYPKEWHEIDIARTFYDMRWWLMHVRGHPDRVEELNQLGFVWGRLQPEWNNVIEALMTYKILNNGDVMVPSTFVVPYGDNMWPRATWGIQLGNCVYRIRSRHDFLQGDNYASRKAQLDGLDFVWDVSEHLFQKCYAALCHFAKLERARQQQQQKLSSHASTVHPNSWHSKRALRVPSNFVVPSGTENGWPVELWDFPLGAKCSAIRHKGLYVKNEPHRRRALEELGFQWSGNASLGWLEVVHAAAIYSTLNGRNLDVPLKFVVPAPPQNSNKNVVESNSIFNDFEHDAWPWPGEFYNL